MLETWRPLLEGMAVAVQLLPPCPNIDDLVPSHSDLWSLELTLAALDGGADPDHVPKRLLSAGYEVMRRGPLLNVGKQSLAVSLERNRGLEWLPYFLGTAYIRALHDRMARKVIEFSCPEITLNWILQLLRGSGARLLGHDTRWDQPAAVEQLYGWIEVVEQTPPARLKQSLGLPWDVDLLTFLETGKVAYGPDTGDASVFIDAIAAAAPAAWDIYQRLSAQVDLDAAAREAGDPPLQLTEPQENTFAAAWLVGTRTLRLCSGGRAWLAGWVPGGLSGRHAVALRVDEATWWLALEESQAAYVPFDLQTLPHLAPEMLLERGNSLVPTSHALSLNCYLTYSGYGLASSAEANPRTPRLLVELSSGPNAKLLASVIPGEGRALLAPVPRETTAELHIVTEELRKDVSTYLAVSLGQLASYAHSQGANGIAALIEAAHRADDLARSRQRDLVSRRILRGLLGDGLTVQARRALVAERMNAFIPDIGRIWELLTLAYGHPCTIDGPGRHRLVQVLEGINASANQSINKPLFTMKSDGTTATVEYLGLWKR